MRSLAICLPLLLASPALAAPMWEKSDTWLCTLERHMRAPSGQTVIEMDPSNRQFSIDFARGRVSSAFVEGEAEIIHRSYYEASGVTYSIIVNAWGYGDYPSIFTEQDGQVWNVAGSGTLDPGNDVWIAVYKCQPDGGQS